MTIRSSEIISYRVEHRPPSNKDSRAILGEHGVIDYLFFKRLDLLESSDFIIDHRRQALPYVHAESLRGILVAGYCLARLEFFGQLANVIRRRTCTRPAGGIAMNV